MRDTDYAFCVARLRAKETELLTDEFISSLIEAQSFDETIKLLTDKGWIEHSETYSQAIKRQSDELWTLLSESVPDKKALESLCILNDYFNIKTAVKCAVTGEDASSFYISPTTIKVSGLVDGIRQKSFSDLNEKYSMCANKAYELAVKTENGQNADIFVDKAALESLLDYGKTADDKIFSKVCGFIVDTSNIKTALRCTAAKKSVDFINASISLCKNLNKDKLTSLSSLGVEELYDYLSHSDYKDGVALYKESPAAFDKWCDDKIVEIIKDSKYVSFGFAPVCAYYYAKLTEIKTVRILLTSKNSGVDKDIIRERMRNLYA